MSNVIRVGMADLNICKAPDVIMTIGLGSCIGLTLYDPVTKIGGMVHYMLPRRLVDLRILCCQTVLPQKTTEILQSLQTQVSRNY